MMRHSSAAKKEKKHLKGEEAKLKKLSTWAFKPFYETSTLTVFVICSQTIKNKHLLELLFAVLK